MAQDTVAFASAFAPSASNAPACAGSALVSASGVMNVTVWLGSVEVTMGLHSHVVMTPAGRCKAGAGGGGGIAVVAALGGQGAGFALPTPLRSSVVGIGTPVRVPSFALASLIFFFHLSARLEPDLVFWGFMVGD